MAYWQTDLNITVSKITWKQKRYKKLHESKGTKSINPNYKGHIKHIKCKKIKEIMQTVRESWSDYVTIKQ